jgi:hypothetical protein
MALASTVCMSLTEYYQYSAAAVFISMGIGVFIGWITMRRWDKKRYYDLCRLCNLPSKKKVDEV